MRVIEIDRDLARRWTEQWLQAGHAVSGTVLSKTPFSRGRFLTCIADDVGTERYTRFEEGEVAHTREADAWFASTLDTLRDRGAKCLVVEDDLSKPSDQALAHSGIPSGSSESELFRGLTSTKAEKLPLIKR